MQQLSLGQTDDVGNDFLEDVGRSFTVAHGRMNRKFSIKAKIEDYYYSSLVAAAVGLGRRE